MQRFDVIVIGSGHAGCEAALAAARLGCSTLVVTGNIDMIAHMSCNPSIGGLGKGHLVREIDALGGEMAKNTDSTGIQFRKLNTRKGPAVQGTRAQSDMYLYKSRMRSIMENQPNLHIRQGIVARLLTHHQAVTGVSLVSGENISARTVIVTTGTFLRGLCHVGLTNFPGGRAGDVVATDLTASLVDCGFEIIRLKTGTPPRLDGATIDFSNLEEQFSDNPLPLFSFSKTESLQPQVSCHITYTNVQTHEIIRENLHQSPLFSGVIQGVGPRYCPSIEDKIHRFATKDRHQVFIEPMGLSTTERYPAGLSTSLPLDVQLNFLRTMPGLESVEINRAGYAVEYDAVNPLQLHASLGSKSISGLYLAGQICGTSGYEEAAAQGLVAGINAAQFCRDKDPVLFPRSDSYIGVMVDDLVTKGIGGEPYRMFTSRAENRLYLREDNADERLRPIGHSIGLVSEMDYEAFQKKMASMAKLHVQMSTARPQELPLGFEMDPVSFANSSLLDLARRGDFSFENFTTVIAALFPSDAFEVESAFSLYARIKYQGYIDRDRDLRRGMSELDCILIPGDFSYTEVPGLSHEARQRLLRHTPSNLGQAARIPGLTPAAIDHLHIYLRKIASSTPT